MQEKVVDAIKQLDKECPRVFMIKDGSTFDVLIDQKQVIGLYAQVRENSKTVWIVKVQMVAMIDNVCNDSPNCVCDNESLQHESYCIFYAPSPQEIYRQLHKDL